MSAARLAEDTVAIRRIRTRGMAEAGLRSQFAALATPRVRRLVFVRRVTLRGAPEQIGRAMQAALAKLAEDERDDVLTFAEFSALAVACARAALSGGLTAWHWRMLGLPPAGAPGEAVAALLIAHPMDAGSAVAALAEQGLLTEVWRTMPEPASARLTEQLAQAGGFAVPAWPDAPPLWPAVAATATLLTRAGAMWRQALAPLPARSEAVRAAAVLALLHWAPSVLRAAGHSAWPALLAHLTGQTEPTASAEDTSAWRPTGDAARSRRDDLRASHAGVDRTGSVHDISREDRAAGNADLAQVSPDASGALDPGPEKPREPGPAEDTALLHGLEITTSWGGVLFLINALQRLDIEVLLAAADAPTGWRLLHDLSVAFGMPKDEALAIFLVMQDLDTQAPPDLIAELALRLEELYRPDGPWPLPLAQMARLRATETHLDLDLAATEIDIALRLSGLDLDPGWVPWLGRVATFHYDRLQTVLPRSG
jgi:hypothetical protein